MTDVVGNPEEERRADFYYLPWSQEAVCRYFYTKVRYCCLLNSVSHKSLRKLFYSADIFHSHLYICCLLGILNMKNICEVNGWPFIIQLTPHWSFSVTDYIKYYAYLPVITYLA